MADVGMDDPAGRDKLDEEGMEGVCDGSQVSHLNIVLKEGNTGLKRMSSVCEAYLERMWSVCERCLDRGKGGEFPSEFRPLLIDCLWGFI